MPCCLSAVFGLDVTQYLAHQIHQCQNYESLNQSDCSWQKTIINDQTRVAKIAPSGQNNSENS